MSELYKYRKFRILDLNCSVSFLSDRTSDQCLVLWVCFFLIKKKKNHFLVNTPQKNVGIAIESTVSVQDFSKQKVEHCGCKQVMLQPFTFVFSRLSKKQKSNRK